MTQSRRRGVRASRIRLERALAEADLPRPTQAALAERIADLENLDAAPKDMVSRVFREMPVDPQSIERVARALGVAAHTVYLTGDDATLAAGDQAAAPVAPAARVPPAEAASRARRGVLILTTLVVVALAALSLMPRAARDSLSCRLQALTASQDVPEGRLGVLIARLDGDPSNYGQRFLADRFLDDPALAPFVSVVTLCDTYSHDVPGDRRVRLDAIRAAAQDRLREHAGHVLLWGERRGNVLNVRLVSASTDLSPHQVELDGRPIVIDERYLELPLDVSRPQVILPDLKKLALNLMQLGQPTLGERRNAAMAEYRSSSEWLKASVVTDRNLRSSIRPDVDPTRWALVNAQLCYKYRLLGDIEASEADYESAVEACEAVIDVRPRDEFPQEWAAVKTNLGSAWLRLHAYAGTQESALDRLQRARAEIEAAAETIEKTVSPQLWAVNRRTLGTIYIRLGELSDDPGAAALFDQGVAELKAALAVQRPEFQPLDWALTQQNICLALYQHGGRLGDAGIPLVREAVQRCEDAAGRLSPTSAGLSWAMVQNNVAASTATLAQLEGDPALLARAAEAFRQAQQVYTRERVPVNWAEVEVNLGELNCNLALLRSDARLLDTATAHTEAALRIFIEHGVARYQRHAEALLGALDACDREALELCRCGGP